VLGSTGGYDQFSLSLSLSVDDDDDNNMIQTRQYVHRIMFSTLGEGNIYFRNLVLQVVFPTRLNFRPLHPLWNVQEASFNGI